MSQSLFLFVGFAHKSDDQLIRLAIYFVEHAVLLHQFEKLRISARLPLERT